MLILQFPYRSPQVFRTNINFFFTCQDAFIVSDIYAIYLFAKYADGQMLGKAVVQNFCTLPSNNQHSSQIVECFPSAEPVSLSEFLDDQSDDGYATSPASSTSPGSMWSVETTPSTVDEDTISSITSFWDEMSNDSTMFKPSLKRSADSSAHGTARKCLKLVEGPQHAEVPKQAADFSSALKHSQLLLHLAGTSTDDPIISLQESSKCPVQSNIKRYSDF